MGNQAGRDTFDSWKEIAAYLRRTEKTCRRWEKELGLPVHRLEDSPRARVFAYRDEVDAWVENAGNLAALAGQGEAGAIASKVPNRRLTYVAVAIVVMLVVVVAWLWIFKKKDRFPSPAPIRSIAILPFEDLSPGKDHEHLADGMTDALIDALCDVPGLHVPARTSSFYFKGRKTPLPEIGRLLHADALIEGSIQVACEKFRLSVQLVKASDGYHLWSEKYDRPMDDVFAVQDEIARAVVQALRVELLDGRQAFSAKDYTTDREAYDYYLRGFFHAHQGERSREGLEKAIQFFEKAIQKDPQYALAYAGLAEAFMALPNYGPYPRGEAYEQAKGAAVQAMELDPGLAEAHVAYGCYLSEVERDRKGEIEHFREAIAFKPGYGWAHNMLAYSLLYQGRIEEGLEEGRRALDLDPLSCVISRDQGGYLYWAGRFDEAIGAFKKALELYPDHSWTYYYLGCAYLEQAMYEEAQSAFQQAFRADPHLLSIYSALTNARMGKTAEARRTLDELLREEESIEFSMKYFHLAVLCLNLQEKGLGFRFLDKSEQNRDQQLGFIKVHPLFKHLHGETEFQAIVKRMRLD
jgi:TolB-like protein/Tfp pilus assembly protein PilF